MSYPSRAAWWPTAVAGLLLASGCGWLWRALPQPPGAPPLATPAVPSPPTASQPGEALAPDSTRLTPELAVAAPQEEPPQEIPADTAIRFAAYDPLADDTLAHPLRERRYMGTLGGRAIVVRLAVGADSVAGSWYYRTGQEPHARILASRRQRNGWVALVEETEVNIPIDVDGATAEWYLRWPLGRAVVGRRRAIPGTSWQTMLLREDYSQAVPYQLLRLTAHGSYCRDEPGRPQPYYSSQFVRVLSADSLRLARWQAPPPAGRRDSLRRWLLQEYACHQVSENIEVTLNDYNLLSYSVWTHADYFGNHPLYSQAGFTVDLRTGHRCLVQALLRPGTEPALLKLLARHLRHDYPELNKEDGWDWQTVPPLPDAFTLTPTGLRAEYDDYALAAYVSHYANTATIPYAELRPLVRPGTPLARLLAARGLW